MATKPKKRGRPKKPESERLTNRTIYLRCDDATAEAVDAYQEREELPSGAHAVRELVRRALREEGLL